MPVPPPWMATLTATCLKHIWDALSALLLACLAWLSAVAAYRLCLHPLAAVPGPPLAALTSCWYAYQARNGRMLHLGKTLHHRYGPVVRVGPNELWFVTRDAFKMIYSPTNGYEKSGFYRACLSR